MKCRVLALLSLAALVLSGCEPEGLPPVEPYYAETHWVKVYYAAAEAGKRDNVIAYEECEIPKDTLEQTVRFIFELSCREPITKSMKSPMPQNVRLEGVSIQEGTVRLNLSREYGNINGFARTVADYCLTMSMCELESVRDVEILVDGVASYGREQKLTPDDVVLADLELVGYRKSLNLYFPDFDYATLKLELRDTVSNGAEEEALLVVKALLDGPTQRGLREVMPYGTRINSVRTVKGVCMVDLSAEYISNRIDDEMHERMCLRALVDSLTELNGIDQVQILIDGVRVQGFTHFDLSKPFSRGYI